MKHVNALLRQIYRQLLRLYPRPFRDEFGEEMTSIFATSVAEKSHRGTRTLTRFFIKELMDLPSSLAVAYWSEFTYREVVMYRKADWGIWPSWVVLHLLSIPLAMFLMLVIVIIINGIVMPYHQWTTAQYVQLPALLLGFAVVMGTLQSLLIHKYLRHGMSWGIVTGLGCIVAALLGYLVWLIAERLDFLENELALAGIIFVIFGGTIGLFQYLVLRKVVAKAFWWIVASTIGYSSLILLVLQPVIPIPVITIFGFLFLITLPASITGVVLFLLLRQTEATTSFPDETNVSPVIGSRTKRRQKSVWIAAGVLALMLFFLVAPLVWTVGQLTLAKADGIYATPEEAMTTLLLNDSGDYEIEQIDILGSEPNFRDGRLPHVWFVMVNIYAEYRSDGKSTAPRGYYSGGSFFIKVEDGLVHVPEGAYPGVMGRVMAWYGLEDCC